MAGLLESAEPVSVSLTGKYPNCASFERIQASSQKRVTFAIKPIDAAYVPPELLGFRTLFNSFHHFQDGHAKQVLADTVQNGQ